MTKGKNLVSTKKETVYKFVGERDNSIWRSIDDMLKYTEGKLPANGKTWEIDEITTITKHHSFESKRQQVNDTEITRRIIDYFCEHATPENAPYYKPAMDDKYNFIYIKRPEYRKLNNDAIGAFLCAKYYQNWSFEYFIETYNEMVNSHKNNTGYFYEDYASSLIVCMMLKEKYHIKDEDLVFTKRVPDNGQKAWANGDEYEWEYDMYAMDEKYPGLRDEVKEWGWINIYDIKDYDGSDVYTTMTKQEALDYYKKVIKSLPIEKTKWVLNTGCPKDGHVYKLEFDVGKLDEVEYPLWNGRIPGIMFLKNKYEAFVTFEQLDGYLSTHLKQSVIDVDERLYEHCIKCLNKK